MPIGGGRAPNRGEAGELPPAGPLYRYVLSSTSVHTPSKKYLLAWNLSLSRAFLKLLDLLCCPSDLV